VANSFPGENQCRVVRGRAAFLQLPSCVLRGAGGLDSTHDKLEGVVEGGQNVAEEKDSSVGCWNGRSS